MKPDDYPLVEFEGRRLRLVPELPGDKDTWARCILCLACPDGNRDQELCRAIRDDNPGETSCAGPVKGFDVSGVYVPEEKFQDYVVELVRRRISS